MIPPWRWKPPGSVITGASGVLSESEEETAARALLVEIHGAVRDTLKRIDASLAEVRERERAFEVGGFRAEALSRMSPPLLAGISPP